MKTPFFAAIGLALVTALPAQANETFKLGYIGGFSRFLAFYDGAHLEGVNIAVDEINKAGGIAGRQIELITRDTRSETQEAAVLAEELLAEGVQAVIAPCDADPTIAIGQVFAATMTPVITTCSTAPTTAEFGGSNVFLSYPSDNVQGAVLAQYASDLGYKTALTVTSADNVYTDLLPEYFTEAFEKLGGQRIDDIKIKLGQADMNAEVTKIGALPQLPDVIMTAIYEPDFPILIKALRAAGITTPVLEVDGIDSPTTFALGDVVEGVTFTNAGFPAAGSPLEAFNTTFNATYGRPSETTYNANGYDVGQTFRHAAEMTKGDLSGPALTAAINDMADVPNLMGTITYAGMNRVPLVNVAINRIEKGAKVFVKDVLIDPALIPAAR